MHDTLSIPFEKCTKEITKREVLKQLVAIYDPLGLKCAVTLVGR